MSDEVSGSRLKRLGRLAWMSRKAVPLAVRRFAGRGEEAEQIDPVHMRAAEAMLETLGDLKGLALKVGQMLSYMDGALPAEAEPAFRKVLARLQRQAPSLPWVRIEQVLIEELGPLQQHFERIEPEPFAAASIGQVHRALLRDGTAVAVKVQYPGIRKAIEADLNNLGMFELLARPMMGAFGSSTKFAGNILEEIRDRLLEELDYRHEAAMQARFQEMFAPHEQLVIPAVYPEHGGDRVLTTELMEGESLDAVVDDASQDLRNAWAEVLTAAITDQLYVHGLFNGDPHPGNYLFRRDGSVVLLDFGCVKKIDAAMQADMRRYAVAAIRATATDRDEDWAAFDRALADALLLHDAEPGVIELFRQLLLYVMRPLLRDEPFTFTPEYTAGVNDLMLERKKAILFADGRKLPHIPKMPAIPGQYTFINRLQWGFYSVLSRLGATVNWHQMLPEDMRTPFTAR